MRLLYVVPVWVAMALLAARGFGQTLPNGVVSGGGAEAYYQLAHAAVPAVLASLPEITKSASEAAKDYIDAGLPIMADGDPAFEFELVGRCGGLMSIQHGVQIKDADPWKGIVLFGLRGPAMIDKDVARLKLLHEHGCKIAGFGPKRWLTAARSAGATFDWSLDNQFDGPDGLLQLNGKPVVPTSDTANLLVGWTWVGEFTAACTRLGKMPTMYKGFIFPGGKERAEKIGKIKFHDGTPQAVPAGEVGTEYLNAMSVGIDQLQSEMVPIQSAARLFVAARAAGKTCYCFPDGHAVSHTFKGPYNPKLFSPIGDWAATLTPKIVPGDFVFGLGYVKAMGGGEKNYAETYRNGGATLVWAVGGLDANPKPAAVGNDVFINEHWPDGDAMVQFPGYDIKILPPSGVIQTIIYDMVCAEMIDPDSSK